MTQYRIGRAALRGEMSIPSSKSHTLRSILFGAMGNGLTTIRNYLPSPDTISMIEACRIFGANIDLFPDHLVITGLNGVIQKAENVIHAGNSGIVLRFCSALGALATLPVVVTGDDATRYHRPMGPLLKALQGLHVTASSMRGDEHAPVIVQGPIRSGKVTILGEDSQAVSALIIAAAFSAGPVEVCVAHPGERPWIDLTLHWFDTLGITYERMGYDWYRISGKSTYPGFDYAVPGDLSSAAFPIAAALVTNSEIHLENVDVNDPQGDKEFIFILQKMGANIEIDAQKKTLTILKGSSLHGMSIDINNCIDALPICAVVACFAEGETRIYNGAIARKKESDRIRSMAAELRKMGADITEVADGLVLRKSRLHGAQVHSHLDHRVAMSLTIAGLMADGETTVSSVECISKTFPSFLQEFNALGANILECT